MLLMVKDIIKKENTNKTAICFYSAVRVGMLYDLQALSYAAFWVFSKEGENKRSSFL